MTPCEIYTEAAVEHSCSILKHCAKSFIEACSLDREGTKLHHNFL